MEPTQIRPEDLLTRGGARPLPTQSPTEGTQGCLQELFEAQVDASPDAPALICSSETLTYAELDALANRFARALHSRNIGPGKLVGLYLERSAYPIIAILGCLKAGAAYVPIDPAYPADRIRHIIEESELSVLVTEELLEGKAREVFPGSLITIDSIPNEISKELSWRLSLEETRAKPSDLCYVIYTSGTTGRPKGVMTEHRSAFRFVRSFNKVCGVSPADRVYQGFSLGFDGSVEEMWMAFSNGATLVAPTRNSPRFGNELAQFLDENRITYFSTVPTLLSTMTMDIPSLKYLVVSGEMCPPELVNRWTTKEREMWNVYGPTEATVNTTAKRCFPAAPVTIGKPLEGYHIYILDPDKRPVSPGEKGELYIAGVTLSRGYLKQPQLTAEKYVESPYVPGKDGTRLYKTGDLVRLLPDGELEFFGRIDTQVKIRGFRVELSEIENVLMENKKVRVATVKLVEREPGLQELAAYVMLRDDSSSLDRNEILDELESRLPHYMIPGHLDVLAEFPMLTSGKVDRGRLPPPKEPLVRQHTIIIEPATPLEIQIAKCWSELFKLKEVSVEDDFFLDLGGHSLLAAQMVTRLRAETHRDVAVRDAYKFPTVRKLATHLESLTRRETKAKKRAEITKSTSESVFESLSVVTRLATVSLQATSILFFAFLATTPLCAFLVLALRYIEGTLSLGQSAGYAILLGLLLWPVMLILSIASKWVLVGRYKAGSYPLWSLTYFRWWLATRLQALSGAGAFAGTPILPLYYRLMGAKVGKRCTIDTVGCAIWDCVAIGDDTSIGADSQILGYRVENGMLHLGSVEIGKNCFVGIHSTLGLNTRMNDGARLDDQSMLPDGTVMLAGEERRGSPAHKAEVNVPEGNVSGALDRPVLYGLLHFVLADCLGIALALPGLLFLLLYYAGLEFGGLLGLSLSLLLSIPVGAVVYPVYIAAMKRLILGKAKPGVYPLQSGFYLRKWLSDELMKVSRSLLHPLYTTLYMPHWLRLMGAKIGARSELSTVWYFSPELMDVGEESFFADGSIVGGKRIYGGRFEISTNRVGRRSFVGNSAILPVGGNLGSQCLLGVLSSPPKEVKDGTEWLGSPAFRLPNRPKVAGFSNDVIYRPTKKMYLQRALIDGLRVLIPGYLGLFAAAAEIIALFLTRQKFGTRAMFLSAPLFAWALGILVITSVIAIKKIVMGTFKPVIRPLWSPYVWFNEMINGIYESVMAPILSPLLGTPFLAPFLRGIGCKIGRHTFIESILFSEFDLVEVGDYAALNFGSIIQTHLFEDRIMKSSYLKVGDGSSVGNMAVVLYDTEMKQGSTLGPLSLLMKGETLSSHGCYHGIPTIQVSDDATTIV